MTIMRVFLALALTLAPSIARADAPAMVTQAQLDALGRLVDATPDDSADKPALLHRRAELYLQQADFYAAHPERPAAADKGTQWQLAGAKELLTAAELPRFSTYARADEVLFRLARELTVAHREAAGRRFFKQLITDYPQSKFIPDAFFAFGDFYFEQHDCETASKFYDKVLSLGPSRVYEAARGKLDACAGMR
jgi:TolA-binding protein